jgi:hypothetical protein
MEYFVEYYPTENEGEQAQELTKSDFVALIRDHKARGLDALIEYDVFTVYDHGRSGERLTIRDEYGIFYC